jgi:negative regulator of sigma E activity
MKATLIPVFALIAGVAQAHESLAPHHHPHDVSWLPSVSQVGVAALILAIAVIVITQIRRG